MKVLIADELKLYDRLLGPVAASARGSENSVVAALCMKGVTNDLDPAGVMWWISTRMRGTASSGGVATRRSLHGIDEGGAPVAAKATSGVGGGLESKSPASFYMTWNAVERAVLSSTSVSRRDVLLDVAARLYAGLLLPLPTFERVLVARQLNARVVFGVIGLRIINAPDLEQNGVLRTARRTPLSASRLAATLGFGEKSAYRTLEHLEEMGMVKHPQGSAWIPGKYAMPEKKISVDVERALDPYRPSIAALVDGEPDAIADVIRSLLHPIWSYSEQFSHLHWMTLLADTAGIPVSTFGLRPVIERRVRKLLEEELLTPQHGWALPGNLDRLADDPAFGMEDKTTGERLTARQAHGRAEANWRAAADAIRDSGLIKRESKRLVYEGLDELLDSHPMPKTFVGGRESTVDARKKAVRAWTKDMHDAVWAARSDEEFRHAAVPALEKKMLRAKHGSGLSRVTAGYIMLAPASMTYKEYRASLPANLSETVDDDAAVLAEQPPSKLELVEQALAVSLPY